VIIATDRRLLVSGSAAAIVLDVPYDEVSRFEIEWKQRGRIGVLSLAVAGEAHVISSIAPANLLSIARALQSHGVDTDDPAAVAEAERAWDEALRRGRTPIRVLDRAAMRTREYDRGLWLLLALCALLFYLNPLGVGTGAARDALPALLAVPLLCGICGYVSRTGSSLAYLAPLNLLVAPAFFFVDAGEAITLMLVLSALATVGLSAGSALGAGATASPRHAARGSLRAALSGAGLIRISTVMLCALLALVATAGTAGYELSTLRLAVDEVTAEQLPVDGRSNLSGGAATLTYTPGPGLRSSWPTSRRSTAPATVPAGSSLLVHRGLQRGDARSLHRRAAARRPRGGRRLHRRQGSGPLGARRLPGVPHAARRRRPHGLRLGARQPARVLVLRGVVPAAGPQRAARMHHSTADEAVQAPVRGGDRLARVRVAE
jgi:hypothetical protein